MKVHKGMKVRIMKCNVTDKHFRTTREMKSMVGEFGTITDVWVTNDGHEAATIDEWTWSPEDLCSALPPPDIKEKKVIFDPKDLVL